MDVAEEATLVRLPEDGPTAELDRPADVGGGLDRADGELEPVAEALDSPEDADGVAFPEAAVEELDVLPHARVDAAARIDKLEREVRRSRLRPQPLLPRHAVDAFDHPVLGELDDRGHEPILVPATDAPASVSTGHFRRTCGKPARPDGGTASGALGSAVVEPWLETCRAAAEDVRRGLVELPGRAAREPVVGAGEGGDETTAIDAAAEAAILGRLEETGEDFVLVSEELGERRFGAGGRLRVVVDPIDGSLNAKRGLPHFCLSIAVADGDTMADVEFAYLYDFGSGEEWTARRGVGAFLGGRPLGSERPKDEIETPAFEATLTSLVAQRAAHVVGLAYRLRIMGSLALALCNLAAGRLDGVCSLKPARAVDLAAAPLLVGDDPRRPFQTLELTADWTFLRFHTGSDGGRYTDEELERWARRIEDWRARIDVYAYFNNDWQGFALENAAWLKARLEGREPPEILDRS